MEFLTRKKLYSYSDETRGCLRTHRIPEYIHIYTRSIYYNLPAIVCYLRWYKKIQRYFVLIKILIKNLFMARHEN